MSKTKYHISDYSLRLPDGNKFDYLGDYSDDQWLLVQMQIDANARERERQERKAERDFKLALIFLSCLGTLCLSFFVAVLASSFVAVNQIQQQVEIQEN